MCGIAGIIGRRDERSLAAMVDALVHRGPDDAGIEWVDSSLGPVGLGHRRLSIIDLSAAGHQPMRRGDSLLVYNGEIYNFARLREELVGDGESFVSSCDTEVLLALLSRRGVGALRAINGMYAFGFWDGHAHEVVLARDPFGIKPLYYVIDGGTLRFASEVGALLRGGLPARLDAAELSGYLSFGWVTGDNGLIEGVRELPPGWVLRWNGTAKLEQVLDPAPAPDMRYGLMDAAADLRGALASAVGRQLVADVPVGVLLSGGLDSSTIAVLAAEAARRPTHAYTIGFSAIDAAPQRNRDDLTHARLVARRAGLELHEIEVTPAVSTLLHEIGGRMDSPVADPAAVLTLMIAEAARHEVGVLLSGHGADELLGGYRTHTYAQLAHALARQPKVLRRAEAAALDRLCGVLGRVDERVGSRAERLRQVAGPGLRFDAARAYVALRSSLYFSPQQLDTLLTQDAKACSHGDPWQVHEAWLDGVASLPFLDRVLYCDIKTFLLKQNLVYSDRYSMAASMELRVPFLDDEVAEVAFRCSPRLQMYRGTGKRVLRSAMRGIVPAEVLSRSKAGFGLPLSEWLRQGELLASSRDVLSNSWLRETGLFEPSQVDRLWKEHESGTVDHTMRLWSLVAFASWYRSNGVTW